MERKKVVNKNINGFTVYVMGDDTYEAEHNKTGFVLGGDKSYIIYPQSARFQLRQMIDDWNKMNDKEEQPVLAMHGDNDYEEDDWYEEE